MRYLKTNTATRVTVGPFIDKGDGFTPEVSLTVTSEKLTFVVDNGGVPTLVLDTAPTASGGANDMVHIANDDAGYYDLELAAADVNYVGRACLSLNDVATHLPVFHEFMILSAQAFEAMCGTGNFSAEAKVVTAGAINNAAFAADVGSTALATNIIALAAEKAIGVAGVLLTNTGIPAATVTALGTGSGLTALGTAVELAKVPKSDSTVTFNATALASVKTQVTTALTDIKLDHLIAVADADDAVDNSIIAKLASKGATADWSTFVNTTDSLEANRDNIGTTGAGLTTMPAIPTVTAIAAGGINNAAFAADVGSTAFATNIIALALFKALDAAITDAVSLTEGGLLEKVRRLTWIIGNKIAVTDANGNTVIYKDDSTTAAYTVNAMLTDNSTTTTRLRAA